MLRYAFRRMLWVFPSVLGVSLISFYLLSLIPSSIAESSDANAGSEYRERFLDLPLFFNVAPRDVRTRTARVVDDLVAAEDGSPMALRARRELLRLGGAVLPVLLPRLDALKPEDRLRVALALAPMADRMGLPAAGKTRDREQAVLFWNRFWETRGVEFREASTRSAVRRFARYGTDARAEQLRVLDTYALPLLIGSLEEPSDPGMIAPVRRVVGVIADVTGRHDTVSPRATVEEVTDCVQRWRRWWLVYEADFQPSVGADRVAAFALQTQYGKWVFETVVLRMGKDDSGVVVLDQLLRRARVTLTMLLLGLALAYLLAVPLGSLAAAYRGQGVDRMVAAAVLIPYAASPAVIALVAVRFGAPFDFPMAWAVVLVALVLLADPVRHQRAELLPILTEDYVRAAIARGANPFRVLLVHGLRNAMLPVATRAALELPVAVTACFVIEKVLGIRGLGEATLDAVSRADASWLMALALAGAVFAVMTLVVSVVAYALLDPRLRSAITSVRRRRA